MHLSICVVFITCFNLSTGLHGMTSDEAAAAIRWCFHCEKIQLLLPDAVCVCVYYSYNCNNYTILYFKAKSPISIAPPCLYDPPFLLHLPR